MEMSIIKYETFIGKLKAVLKSQKSLIGDKKIVEVKYENGKKMSYKNYIKKELIDKLIRLEDYEDDFLDITLIICSFYIQYFDKYELDDVIKTLNSREHYFSKSPREYYDKSNDNNMELAYKMVDSVIRNEFSAQLMLKFAFNNLVIEFVNKQEVKF